MFKKTLALIPIALGLAGLALLRHQSPTIKLALASLGMIWLIKLSAYLWQWIDGQKPASPFATFLYFAAWPGISLQGFTEQKPEPPAETGRRFLLSWLFFLGGVALLLAACVIGRGQSTAWNYMSALSFFFIIHLGLMELIADGLRLLGFSPASLFDRPWLAISLRDFWSLRWNRAFVDMNKIFVMQPLRGKLPAPVLVFSIFLFSGLLHELGISFASDSSWGLPLLYFACQGLGLELERYIKLPRPLVWLWILLPIPLLFTPTFTNLFLGGLGAFVAEYTYSLSLPEILRDGLILGGAGHLLVLCASVQVPGKLGWKNEFQKLAPLNRKVFWTYGGYIFAIIVFMAIVSFILSANTADLYSPASRLWLAFIALFWWARVLTDFFYFDHRDWPQGPLFTIGHICLTTLFLSLAALYSALAIFCQ